MELSTTIYDAWLLVLTGTAALTDIRSGRIPNSLTLPTLAIAPLVHALQAGPGALAASIAGAAFCGAVPLLLFSRRALGGGDVKLFAAEGALLGTVLGLELQIATYALAALLALAWLAFRGELLAVLGRAVGLIARAILPGRQRTEVEPQPLVSLRLGAFAFGASVCLVARNALEP